MKPKGAPQWELETPVRSIGAPLMPMSRESSVVCVTFVAEARIGETTERAETCIATVVLILIRQCLCVICRVVAQ